MRFGQFHPRPPTLRFLPNLLALVAWKPVLMLIRVPLMAPLDGDTPSRSTFLATAATAALYATTAASD